MIRTEAAREHAERLARPAANAFQEGQMRQKFRSRHRLEAPVQGDPTPIDLGATARQIGLFETSIGWQHGFIDILVALGAALMLLPLRAFLRRNGRDSRSRRPGPRPTPEHHRRARGDHLGARDPWK